MDTLWIGVTDRLGELPAVRALDLTEQAEQITPEPLAYFRAGATMGDARTLRGLLRA